MMNKLLLFTSALLIAFSPAFAQKNVSTEKLDVKDFTSLEVNGEFDLVLKQGDVPKAFIEGTEAQLKEITFTQKGDHIEFRNREDGEEKKSTKWKKNRPVIYVQFVDLTKIETAMVGEMTSDNDLKFNTLDFNYSGVGDNELVLSANEFNLEFDGVGQITLKGKANKATMECNGIGKVMAKDFVVRDLEAECNGIGSMHVNAEQYIKMEASGIGSVKNHGNAKEPAN
ncbi:head GIN domain-containing protein [Flammeovirga sp. OC4]|uniref:head GIN domain-containing protein n=1 Tax=Flammeovirga sp. OC4 TaxID=1382345 RepID=UPI00155DA2FE|nr:head GIN domain-containing protein [Flammeovirga sp. OC4]